ncbi:hypothetical protein [Bradyrhizobium sp. C9]|uniref:hypothetical protein n=1 Tax=Bradyrhizobium sp. C9 TaxID=142585 RepID=UPI000BEA3512|nr:hypothetical protein [Bradyrhizobium sp. C9]PDT74113.1 hypothetical protein CO675_26955 [Bradyrhizobium sp. C9]
MLTAILAFFQAIPAITGGINNFVSKYYDAKVQITTARIGGDVTVARALVSGVVAEGGVRVEFLKAVSQSRFLMCLVGGFAFPWIAYEWKVVLWDNMLCPALYGSVGFTPTIQGLVADWSGVILAGIFGTGSVMAVGQMFFNRKQS